MPLSQRQSQILELIKVGASNKEIAQRLRLTTGTVKQHVHALFRKLGVTSRTMAVARANALALAPPPAGNVAAAGTRLPDDLRYSRRLVTVVAIEPRAGTARTAREAAHLHAAIELLHERVGQLAFAFDGRAEPLPGGNIAAWFGQPAAHGDDAERALAFVQALDEGRSAAGVDFAVGVATALELVGEGERSASGYHSAFRAAMQLAGSAQGNAIATCPLTQRLGSPPDAGVARRWGGLPFLADLVSGMRERRCQWLSVESWPPEAGTRLMDAMAACLGAARIRVQRLWMPLPGGGAVAQQLAWQLGHRDPASAEPLHAFLGDSLARAASHGPLALFAHGIDALRVLSEAIGEHGIARLRSLPIVVVAGAMQRAGTPQTVVRLLGQHPLSTPFIRVLRLEVPPTSVAVPDGIRPDVQAVLDALSLEARAIARLAAHPQSPDIAAVARALGLSTGEVLARCRELEAWGLLSQAGDRVQFRDEATAAAVRASLA